MIPAYATCQPRMCTRAIASASSRPLATDGEHVAVRCPGAADRASARLRCRTAGLGSSAMVAPESLSVAQARRIALAAQGFADPRPAGCPTRAAPAPGARPHRAAADRLGQRAAAGALPAALQPARALPDRAARPRRPTARPAELFEYWGHEASLLPVELQPLLRWRMASAHGDAWGGMRRHRRRAARAGRLGARRGARPGPADRGRDRARRAPADTDHWGWNWSDASRRWSGCSGAGEVTAAGRDQLVRAASTTCPSGCCRAAVLAAPTPSAAEAYRDAGRESPPGRWAWPPSRSCATTSGSRWPGARSRGRRAGRGRRAACRSPWSRAGGSRPTCTARRRLPRRVAAATLVSPFDPLIWERAAHRAAVRLPLPDRDLRARRAAGARLLRAAVPARRPVRRPGRPQGRPPGRGAAGAGRLGRAAAWRPGGRPPRRWPPSCVGSPAGSGWSGSPRRARATWPPRWPPRCAGAPVRS